MYSNPTFVVVAPSGGWERNPTNQSTTTLGLLYHDPLRKSLTAINNRSYAVGIQTGRLTRWKPDSPAAAWYCFIFFTLPDAYTALQTNQRVPAAGYGMLTGSACRR